MSLWICADCTCRYSVGAECCPHCQSTNHTEEHPMGPYTCKGCGTSYRLKIFTCPRCKGTDIEETPMMAKITRAGGPSNADADAVDGDTHYYEQGGDVETADYAGDTGNEGTGGAPEADSDPDNVVSHDGHDPQVTTENEVDNDEDTSDLRELYESQLVEDLRAELRERKLAVAGIKPELVDRLLEDDAARAAEADQAEADQDAE